MEKFKLYCAFLIVVFLHGCTTPIEELPDSPGKLVVQSEFKGGEAFDIFLFKGVNFPLEGENPATPQEVELEVWCEGVQLDVQRIDDAIPRFKVGAHSAFPGQRYELKAKLTDDPEISTVSAVTSLPEKDSVMNFKAITDTISDVNGGYTVKINISFDISSNNHDRYYELAIKNEAFGTIMPPVDTLWQPVTDEQPYLTINSIDLPAGISYLKSRNSLVIDHFKLINKHIKLGMELHTSKISDVSRLRLILKSHTADGFNFIRSYDKFHSDYYAEFPILVSNIRNGIGIFTAYEKSVSVYDLKNR